VWKAKKADGTEITKGKNEILGITAGLEVQFGHKCSAVIVANTQTP
jgi:hypothetical protein